MRMLSVNSLLSSSIVQCIISILLAYIIAYTLMLIWYDHAISTHQMFLPKRLEYAMSNLYNFYFLFFLYSQAYLIFLILYDFCFKLRTIYLLIFAIFIGWLTSGTAYLMKEFIMYLTNHRNIFFPSYSTHSLETAVIYSFTFIALLSGGWLLGTFFFFLIVKFSQKVKPSK